LNRADFFNFLRAGDSAQGAQGLGGSPAVAGFNAGDGKNGYNMPLSHTYQVQRLWLANNTV